MLQGFCYSLNNSANVTDRALAFIEWW